jgi:multicomponent Na+:H+ antiporter subunit C
MEYLLALTVGVLCAAGFYLLMSPSISRLILGILVLSLGGNILIFAAAGLGPGSSAIIPEDQTQLTAPHADPLPQALILTAIVIGFAISAFAMVLLKRVYLRLRTEDVDQLRHTEQW